MKTEIIEAAQASLLRVQEFDISKLPREKELGQHLNFKDAVEPANRILNLFRQFPAQFIGDLPDEQINSIRSHADSFFEFLTRIVEFSSAQDNANSMRTNLINEINNQYQHYFNSLCPLISYGASRQRDFSSMEREFRASMQKAKDSAAGIIQQIDQQQQEAQRILAEVKKIAAEQGVSQQASYFKEESDFHHKQAKKWMGGTVGMSILISLYAIASALIHKWEWIAPNDVYQSVQLTVSKILIFAVLAYILIFCAKNYLAHRHNAVVNKHRQNALMTFNSLADAADSVENRDVVLTYAAACIFSPQESGYSNTSGGVQSELPLNIIQTIPKMTTAGSASVSH